jgi:hypothetical protein
LRTNLPEHTLQKAMHAAMVGVDVGCDFEDEPGELRLSGLHYALLGLGGLRAWGYLDKAVEQFLNTEVVERRAEEHRSRAGMPYTPSR